MKRSNRRPTPISALKADIQGVEKLMLALVEMHGLKKLERYFRYAVERRAQGKRPWYVRVLRWIRR